MSVRLSALNVFLRTLGRPILKRTKSPERARRDFDLAARLVFRGPRSGAHRSRIGGVSVLDVVPRGADEVPVLLYLHGGGYVTGSARSHLPMVAHLAGAAGLRAVIPDYRLAPEHPFPAAFEDAVAVWRGLRDAGVPSDRIVLGGDSAGGGLALALLSHLVSEGEVPAGLFAFSPWTDLTLSCPSLDENAKRDAILPVERIRELCGLIAPGADPADPRLSPHFAPFTGAPPVYLQASESEILRDDTLRLAGRLEETGVSVRADLWPDTPHVWQIFRGWVPEADDALARVVAFIRDCLSRPPRRS